MQSSGLQRLQNEYEKFMEEMEEDENPVITACPVDEDDMFVWEGTIIGEEGTPYEGGTFVLNMNF